MNISPVWFSWSSVPVGYNGFGIVKTNYPGFKPQTHFCLFVNGHPDVRFKSEKDIILNLLERINEL